MRLATNIYKTTEQIQFAYLLEKAEAAGFYQERIAELMKVDKGGISRMRRGLRPVLPKTLDHLKKTLAPFGISIDEVEKSSEQNRIGGVLTHSVHPPLPQPKQRGTTVKYSATEDTTGVTTKASVEERVEKYRAICERDPEAARPIDAAIEVSYKRLPKKKKEKP